RIDPASAVETALRIGIVEIVKNTRDLNALVIIDLVLEDGVHAGALIEHEMLADHTTRIGQALREEIAGGIEQQACRFRAIRRQHDGPCLLEMSALVAVEVVHSGRTPLS